MGTNWPLPEWAEINLDAAEWRIAAHRMRASH